ncbi:MAG: hypothetical protein AAGA66_07975 [Bacteroidota bacterium]
MRLLLKILFVLMAASSGRTTYAQQMIPEYTSRAAMDASQYVDPVTGDFRYQTLLLEVPGAQGSFPVILSYQAGIALDQQSSWIGLGFNVESGAIYRSVSQVPDDYRRDKITVIETDPGVDYRADIPNAFEEMAEGISRNASRLRRQASRGFKPTPALYSSLGDFLLSVGQFQTTINPAQAASGGLTGMASYALQMTLSATTYPKFGNTGLSSWDYTVVDTEEKKKFLFFVFDKDKVFKASLDRTSEQNAYGFLYEHDKISYRITSGSYFLPTFTDGSRPELFSYNNPRPLNSVRSYDSALVTSDYYQYEAGARFDNTRPVFSAPDQYVVSTPFLSGDLMPVRFDNVSLSSSNISNLYHDRRIATYSYAVPRKENTLRPQFVFKQDHSNHFDYFDRAFAGNNQALGYESKPATLLPLQREAFHYLQLTAQPSSLSDEEPIREGYDGNGTLKKGVDVRWYTNEEISNGTAQADGFLDYQPDRLRGHALNATEDATDTQFEPKGVGGYTLTDKSGFRYHFALPVYERRMENHLEVRNPALQSTYTARTVYDVPFAKKWLLTAITGPDFVDVGTLPGYVDAQDKGHYVVLNYGKYSSDSYWDTPTVNGSQTYGWEQQYFLNTIATNTHTAMFLKAKREDYQVSEAGAATGDLLALKEIILLNNEDYQRFFDNKDREFLTDETYNGAYSKNVLKVADVYGDSLTTTFIHDRLVRRITFDQDYALQANADTQANGKLTLNGLDFYGKQNVPVLSGMRFGYASNPDYEAGDRDAWGLYKDNDPLETDPFSVTDSLVGSAWSVATIRTPTNVTLEMDYERDRYEKVDTVARSPQWGGNLRVKSITTRDVVSHLSETCTFAYSNGYALDEPVFLQDRVANPRSQLMHQYPTPQVIYQEVEKRRASAFDPSRHLYRERYTFSVPERNTFAIDTLQLDTTVLSEDATEIAGFSGTDQLYRFGQQLKQGVYRVTRRDNHVRLPLTIQVRDASDALMSETRFTYEDSPLGTLSQAAHLLDHSYRNYQQTPREAGTRDYRMTYRFVNTSVRYVPARLAATITTDHTRNLTTTTHYLDHQFYTGEPLKVVSTNQNGNLMLSEHHPAFLEPSYQGMGLRTDGGTNQLTAASLSETYDLSPQLTPEAVSEANLSATLHGLLGSGAQTWQRDPQTRIWRPRSGFAWIGEGTLNDYGSHDLDTYRAHPFPHEAATEPHSDVDVTAWEKQNEVTSYWPNGIAKAYTDINGNKGVNLVDPEGERVIASVIMADLHEVGYSGAEYTALFENTPEGQVAANDGVPSASRSHSGDYSLLVQTGYRGFSFELGAGDTEDKHYKASVWVYPPGDVDTPEEIGFVELAYYLDGERQGAVSPTVGKHKSKSWYRLELIIPPGSAGKTLEVVCENEAIRAVYFDDFRVQPLSSSMTAYAYDKKTDEVTHVLNNDNRYLKYEYDELGNTTGVLEEFFYPVDKVIQRSRINYSQKN